VVELLGEQQADALLAVGGTIPADDIPGAQELAVSEVFTSGASTQETVDVVSESRHR
jgi:methylmalonyl-CoA mutase C-terminal domain/subunit